MADEKTRILVCDDSDSIRLGLVRLLSQSKNFEVVAATTNGEQAIECSEMMRPDVVIMDVNMPTMNGIEAAIRIKSKLPATKIIMLSDADDDPTIFKSLASGVDGYCLKRLLKNLTSIIHEKITPSNPHLRDFGSVSFSVKSLSF